MNKAIKRREVKPPPKQARARERQAAILDAARKLVLEGPPTDLSTTRIAIKAGVPVGSIYRYFEDKEDILEQLYRAAYKDVEISLTEQQAKLSFDADLGQTIHKLLDAFWHTARTHPTFIPLTRWANSHYSLWDATPGRNSSLDTLVQNALLNAGVQIPDNRKAAAQKTLVMTISVLADVIIEENEAETARSQIEELAILLEAYVRTFNL